MMTGTAPNSHGLGGYWPGESCLHRLDPRTKLLGLLLWSSWALVIKSPWSMATLVLFLVWGIRMAGIPPGSLLGSLKGFFWLFLFTAVMQMAWAQGEPIWRISLGPLALGITREGMARSSVIFLRLGIIIIGGQLVSATTSPSRMGHALGRLLSPIRHLGLPTQDASLALSISLQFLPILRREAEDIKKAQISRGIGHLDANPFARFLCLASLFVPVVARAVRRSEELALAMVSRGYREGIGRTSLHPLSFGAADALAGATIFAVVLVSVLAGHIHVFQ